MGELIRATRNTFDTIEERLAGHPDVLARLKTRAKLLSTEVRFTIEPQTPDSITLAKVLEGHGETGRTGTALDRIRETCLGQTPTSAAPTTSSLNEELEETITAPTPTTQVSATAARSAADFVSWKELVGDLAEQVGIEVSSAPKRRKRETT